MKQDNWTKLDHNTKENYPPSEEVVLIALRNNCTGKLMSGQAYYIAPRSREYASYNEYELDLDYDEEKDINYWPEGWYESSYESEVDWVITTAKVEYWMPWPELPMEE